MGQLFNNIVKNFGQLDQLFINMVKKFNRKSKRSVLRLRFLGQLDC